MAKSKTQYRCSECGYRTLKWVGRCPECGTWATMEASLNNHQEQVTAIPDQTASPITTINPCKAQPYSTGIGELDRVLGGGLTPGSVTLLAGDPGIGKSTLLLELAYHWALAGRRSLYISGEESGEQIRRRAERINCSHNEIYLATESNIELILSHITITQPSLVVIDSIQTMTSSDIDGIAGGVTQIRAVTAQLTAAIKQTSTALILVGHVTKEGAIAGPRSLEHLVDVVLHIEGDRHATLRTIRAVKNRFGGTEEVGCFLLGEHGITEISDPSGLFLDQRHEPVSGTAITVSLDGRRPFVGEIQALLTSAGHNPPRRTVSGVDHARSEMIGAVLEKHAGLAVNSGNVYLSTVGGMQLRDSSTDLAVALALASAYTNLLLPTNVVVIGEIGLAGELRSINGLERRLTEAARLGFTLGIVPVTGQCHIDGLTILPAETLKIALGYLRELSSGSL